MCCSMESRYSCTFDSWNAGGCMFKEDAKVASKPTKVEVHIERLMNEWLIDWLIDWLKEGKKERRKEESWIRGQQTCPLTTYFNMWTVIPDVSTQSCHLKPLSAHLWAYLGKMALEAKHLYTKKIPPSGTPLGSGTLHPLFNLKMIISRPMY